MKQLVEYELEDGSSIIVEVDLPEAGIERAGRGDEIIKAKEQFGEVLAQVKPVAQTIISTLGSLTADEIGVEFGIKLGARAGIIIASADTEANFTVKLTWKRENVHAPSQAQPPAPTASPSSE